MFKRRAIKKLLRETVETSIIVASNPLLSVDLAILELLPDEVWKALSTKYFSDTAHDGPIVEGASRVLARRRRGFENDLIDLLEDKIEYTKIRCQTCGSRMYAWKKPGEDYATGVCLKCYKVIPKEEDKHGDSGESSNSGDTPSQSVPDVPATPV